MYPGLGVHLCIEHRFSVFIFEPYHSPTCRYEDSVSAANCCRYQCASRLDDKNLDVRLEPDGFVEGRQVPLPH